MQTLEEMAKNLVVLGQTYHLFRPEIGETVAWCSMIVEVLQNRGETLQHFLEKR